MNNPQLLAVLGELNRDPNMRPEWLWTVKASHSASCTYPVTGSLGTANLQVLAVLFKGTNPLSLHFCLWLQKLLNASILLVQTID
jgi:hypothetical protein